jgi:peptide/nickel transport system permease protein
MNERRAGHSIFIIASVLAFITGLFTGLVILGWWLWPVQWVGGTLEVVNQASRENYLRAAIDSYTYRQDAVLASQRYNSLGKYKEATLAAIYLTAGGQTQPAIVEFASAVKASEVLVSKPLAPPAPPGASLHVSGWALGGLCALALLLVALSALFVILRRRSRRIVSRELAHPTESPPFPFARTRKLHLPALSKNVSIWLGACIVGLFVLTALAAPLLAPPDPGSEFSTYKAAGQVNKYIPIPPQPGLILGGVPDPTNQRQLDVWYSLVWGTRSALRFGLLVVLFTGIFGVILGGVSAYLGGVPNTLMMGFTDAFLALPLIAGVIFFQQFILMVLSSSGITVTWLGIFPALESPTAWQRFLVNLDPLLIAFIVFSWMPYTRLMNSVVLNARQEEYILASRSLGAGHLRLIFHHLIPNSISPAVVLAARDVGYLVLLQAGFTFIGLSHSSEWGVLLTLGRKYIIGAGSNLFTWWWTYLPATLAIVLFGAAWNLLGDGLNGWLSRNQS